MEQQFKPGDFITSYYAGYHRVTRIERRWANKTKPSTYGRLAYCIIGEHTDDCAEEINPLIYHVQLFDAKGNPKKSKEKCSESSFCKLAKESIESEIEKLQKMQENLTSMLNANC